jgi:hypothetical protein
MRAAKDGLPTHSGDSEELEDPRWTHAVGAIMEAYFGGEEKHRLFSLHERSLVLFRQLALAIISAVIFWSFCLVEARS